MKSQNKISKRGSGLLTACQKWSVLILSLITLNSSLLTLSAAVPLRWTVETSRATPAQFEAYQGETLALEATLQSYGKPLAVSGIAALYWQTNGMGSVYWETTAAVNSNRLSAVWTPEMDVGAKVYNCFIGQPGTIYHAAFQLRLRPSPGATPNVLPLPVPVIDFAKVRVLNPPWEGGGGGGLGTNAVIDIIHETVAGAAHPLPKYLYALDFCDSYPDAAAEYYAQRGSGLPTASCSAVRSGNFLSRNFDYPFDDRAEFVVKMSAGVQTLTANSQQLTARRYASIGVSSVGTNLTESFVTSGKPSRWYKALPGATVDGINEHGVACNINVVDGDPQTSGWHTGGNIHPLGAVRWALDNGTSASMVASNLAARIAFPAGWAQNYHYMIADASETWVVENGYCVNARDDYADKPYRMLNYGVISFDGPTPIYFPDANEQKLYHPDGSGFERYYVLGGANITNVWYTNAYRRETNPPWVSDLRDVLAYTNAIFDAWASHPKEYFRNKTTNGQPWWQSVHTSIYDITNRVLRVAVQETDDWYTFQVPVALASNGPQINLDDEVTQTSSNGVKSSGIWRAIDNAMSGLQIREPMFIRSDRPDSYRTGRDGELGTGWAYTSVGGNGRLGFAAYVPTPNVVVTLSGSDPVTEYFGHTFYGRDMVVELTSLTSERGDENGKYDVADFNLSMTNNLPLVISIHRNILDPIARLTGISTERVASMYFDTGDSYPYVHHYCYGFSSSQNLVTYYDEWWDDDGNWSTDYRSFTVTASAHGENDYFLVSFGGDRLLTESNRGDAITELVERTGRRDEAGTGWGWKKYEFKTDRRSWIVNVPGLFAGHSNAVNRATTSNGHIKYIYNWRSINPTIYEYDDCPVYTDPFGCSTVFTVTNKTCVHTDGKYGTDGCSNANYRVGLVFGESPLVANFEVEGVTVAGRGPMAYFVPSSQWTLVEDGTNSHWSSSLLAHNDSVFFCKSETYTTSHSYGWYTAFSDFEVRIPCDVDGVVHCLTNSTAALIPFDLTIERQWTIPRNSDTTYYLFLRSSWDNHLELKSAFKFTRTGSMEQDEITAYHLANDLDKHEFVDETNGKKYETAVIGGSLVLREIAE